MPASRFRLSLLGRFELTGLDGPVVLTSKKLAGLLKHQPDASLALFQLQGFRHKWMHELHNGRLAQGRILLAKSAQIGDLRASQSSESPRQSVWDGIST